MTTDQKLELCKTIDDGIKTPVENNLVRHFLISFTTWYQFRKFALTIMPELALQKVSGKQIIKNVRSLCSATVQQLIDNKYATVK